jgi:hypothetical protein
MIDLEEGSSDVGESDSDVTDPIPLQQVIIKMNNTINKLETVEPETIEYSDIDKLFS